MLVCWSKYSSESMFYLVWLNLESKKQNNDFKYILTAAKWMRYIKQREKLNAKTYINDQ